MSRGKLYAPILATLVVLAALSYYRATPSIDDIWVINLDRDRERFQKILDQQHLLPQKVNRWKGTYGKDEKREDAKKDGVNLTLSTSADLEANKRNPNILNIPGEIGCWLSHKRLLQHLNTLTVSPNFGHLILEDDALIDKDFLQKWSTIKHSIPGDWDFIYLGVVNMVGDKINDSILRRSNAKGWGNANHGTYSYIVRHRALPHILEKLRFMSAPIDDQYFYALESLNVYITNPPLAVSDLDAESTIDTQQKRHYYSP